MRQFCLLQKGQALPDQLTWSHYVELLPIKDINIFNEKVLKELILNDISNFMKQLGNGYSYIGSEYPILIGDNY